MHKNTNDIIRYEHFRERALGLMMELRGDNDTVDDAIKIIQSLNPLEALPATKGFSDIYAKAKIMEIASHAITFSYYEALPFYKKILIQAIFDENTESAILEEKAWQEINPDEYQDELDYNNIVRFQEATTEFFESWNTEKVNLPENSFIGFEELESDTKLFEMPFFNVEMDEQEWHVVKNEEAMGSSGMGSCIYVHIKGHKQDGTLVMGGAHFSNPDISAITAMLNDAIEVHNITEKSLQMYLVGGNIAGMPDYLNIVNFAREKIMDVRLCSISTFEQAQHAIMVASNPNKIYFSMSTYLEGFEKSANVNLDADTPILNLPAVNDFISEEDLTPAYPAFQEESLPSLSGNMAFFSGNYCPWQERDQSDNNNGSLL